jgi:hypothetical protein
VAQEWQPMMIVSVLPTQTLTFNLYANSRFHLKSMICYKYSHITGPDIYHGDFDLGHRMDDVFNLVYTWLDKYPKEGIMI